MEGKQEEKPPYLYSESLPLWRPSHIPPDERWTWDIFGDETIRVYPARRRAWWWRLWTRVVLGSKWRRGWTE